MPAPASYARRQFPGAAADTTIVSGINGSVTACTLTATTGWPTGAYTGGVLVELYDLTTGATLEKVWAVDLTGSTLSIVRAADGTSATSHGAGTGVRPVAGAIDADEANRAVNETIGQLTAAGQILVADGTASAGPLQTNTSGQFLQGNGTTLVSVAISGDATVASGGAMTIANDAVTAAKIAANAVGSSEIAGDAVGASEIAALAVGTAELAADAVNGTKIADDSIDSEHYVDGSIDTAHIGNLQVTAAKIANDTITASQIAADAIGTSELAANAVGSSELADNAVDEAALANQAVTLDKMQNFVDNEVIEGVTGSDPVYTQRGRSWAEKMEADSVAIDTTPTEVTSLTIDAVSMVAGRRYKLEFSGSMAITSGSSGFGYVGFRRNNTAFSKAMTTTLTSVTTSCQNMMTFYEPSGDEALDWSIWLESTSGSYNVRIKGAATEEAAFVITDIGLASNA